MADVRMGNGFDAHRFKSGRKLVLCGVEIDYPLGLAGYSDADVAVHALMDAILGALAMGDIGAHFPSDDPAYKDADSMTLLSEVVGMAGDKGFTVANSDITIIAQEPRIRPHVEKMRDNLSRALHISVDRVSVKATTTEGMGFTGRVEGIAALASAVVKG